MFDNKADKAFLGKGWSFPLQLDQQGEVQFVSYEEDIRQAIRLIVETNHNERVMRPDFGANLRALAFEPLNTTTLALARHRLEEALIRWEPRIDSISIKVTADPELGKLIIDLDYRVRATNTFYNLVYPFYLLEGRES
jgi:phage baseplate assembly protein W